MKARQHALSLATAAAVLAGAGVASLEAQARPVQRTMRPDTPRLMVQVFGSADKVAGPEASDELRDRLIRAIPSRLLWVFSKEDLVGTLEQSGYPTNEQLARSDEAALAKMLRADEYIRGNVVRSGNTFRVDAQLVLTRDNGLTQPLPAAEADKPDKAAASLVRAVQDARKQLQHEQRCIALAREQKYDEAIAAADEGIKEYPNATLVRYCKVNVLVSRKAPAAEVVALANEILALDPNSKIALAMAADAQAEAGNTDEANNLLVRLLSTDPTNTSLAAKVVDALAASRKYDVAKEIVNKAVADNPGDIGLIRLQFLILTSAGDYKPAIKVGEEMVQMDTALADTTFFTRLAALYAADSQPQKAAEAAARGTNKFKDNAALWQLYAQTLRGAGQIQQSIAASKRALEINPKIPNGWTAIAVAYNELQMPDSTLDALRQALAAGDDADAVGGYGLTVGNGFFRTANAEEPKQVASFQKGLPFLHFADSTVQNAEVKTNAKFLIGVSSYFVAQITAQNLQNTKSCDDARLIEKAATDAVLYTTQGGRASPETASQIIPAANQLLPYAQAQVKNLCK